MLDLRNFSQSEDFLSFVERIQKAIEHDDRFFIGFVVARHPYWDALKQNRARGYDVLYPGYWWQPGLLLPSLIGSYPIPEYYTSDDSDISLNDGWSQFSPKKGSFLAKVCVTPTEVASLPLRRRLEAICAAETNFFAIVEDRVPPRLSSLVGGKQLTAGSQTGTIGGYLKDQYGDYFGLTCGHVGCYVGDTVSATDTGGGSLVIGKVSNTNWKLTSISAGSLCQVATAANDVDIALVELDPGFVPSNTVNGIGQITDIFKLASLGSGHQVRMCGYQSGAEDYKITGYVVTYKTSHLGLDYCFSNVFEIAGVPSTSTFQLFGQYVPVPKSGDSGAWVTTDIAGGNALCGMLYAVDNARGYVAFTDQMLKWSSGEGHDLTVF